MSTGASACLVLRLAAPLQSWGSASQFNRRDTDSEPTKSGVIGLLAAADGRRREDPILDLLELRLGIRVDQPGTLLRDYHTASDASGAPLLSASVSKKGAQTRTSPPKYTAVTHRFYLQDAVFVAVLEGDASLLEGLSTALLSPGFPLGLGRRSCPPTQPLLIPQDEAPLWEGDIDGVIGAVPWQATSHVRRRHERDAATKGGADVVQLSATLDRSDGAEARRDVPVSFAQKDRAFVTRRVEHRWLSVPTGLEPSGQPAEGEAAHDPFALLGW